MNWKTRQLIRIAAIGALSLWVFVLAQESWAQRRGGGGARPRPNVSRQGPARSGSFDSNRDRVRAPRQVHPAREPSPRAEPRERRESRPERREVRRDIDPGRERDGRRSINDRNDRNDRNDLNDRPNDPGDRAHDRRDDRLDEDRDDRRDYYDDRRDHRRAHARGARYSTVWWTSNSCVTTVVVEADGYSYYQCDGGWFGRTYYGGEVVYTVVDAPPGY
jgi:hypothetical protein